MNNFKHLIVVFDGDIDEIRMQLVYCQYYKYKIISQIFSDIDLNLLNPLEGIKKREVLTVTFYCLKEKEKYYIYSDFFNLNEAFSDSFSFFWDTDSVLMMCEKNESVMNMSLLKMGNIVFKFSIDEKNRDISTNKE